MQQRQRRERGSYEEVPVLRGRESRTPRSCVASVGGTWVLPPMCPTLRATCPRDRVRLPGRDRLSVAGASFVGLVLGGFLFLTDLQGHPRRGVTDLHCCSSRSVPSPSDTLNTANLEATLESQLETQLNASGLTVTCPTVVPVQDGRDIQLHRIRLCIGSKNHHRGHSKGRSGQRHLEGRAGREDGCGFALPRWRTARSEESVCSSARNSMALVAVPAHAAHLFKVTVKATGLLVENLTRRRMVVICNYTLAGVSSTRSLPTSSA